MKLKLIAFFTFIALCVNQSVLAEGVVVQCPPVLTCNWDTGACDTPNGWDLNINGATKPFIGVISMNMAYASAYKGSNESGPYFLTCFYKYGEDGGVFTLSPINKLLQELKGQNWVYGFRKQYAECRIADSRACSGISRACPN